MKLFIFIFFLASLGIKCDADSSADLTCPKSSVPESTLKSLKKHLFCLYDTNVRPATKKDNATLINFFLIPQYVDFEEKENTLNFFTWLGVSWIDQHLVWNPSDYDDIKEIKIKSHDIWSPSITVFNQGNMNEPQMGLYGQDCVVENDGKVQCIGISKYTSHCPTDYEEWPYDKHSCNIHLGGWMFEYAELRFKLDNDSIFMHSFRKNHQWNVHVSMRSRPRSYRVKDADEGEMSILIGVDLQRHGSRLAIVYILPIVVLMVLTMVVLWLDSQSMERIIVACVNFICHVLALSDLHYSFPTQGSLTTPKILLFYEASIGLAAFGMILTCLLRKLRSLDIAAPMWIASSTAYVLNNPVISYLGIFVNHRRENTLIEEGDNNGESKAPKDRTWQQLATILEWTSFVIVCFTYVIMLGVVLPPKAPSEHYVGYWF